MGRQATTLGEAPQEGVAALLPAWFGRNSGATIITVQKCQRLPA